MARSPWIADVLKAYLEFSLEMARVRPGFERVALEASLRDPRLLEQFAEANAELRRGLTELLLARRSEIGHPDAEVAFVLDQIGSMLSTRRDGSPLRPQRESDSDADFSCAALRSVCAYLKVAMPPGSGAPLLTRMVDRTHFLPMEIPEEIAERILAEERAGGS